MTQSLEKLSVMLFINGFILFQKLLQIRLRRRNRRDAEGLHQVGVAQEDLVHLMGDLGVEITDRVPTQYHCNCSKDRVSKAIASIGRKDLEEMIADGEPIEVNCSFCGSHYKFDTEDLQKLLQQ